MRCPSDGRKPERVAILLCVGSRDRQIGREWCSKICCTVSCNIAMEIREELPDCHVYIYYMDIRTYGLYETKYYWQSQEEYKVKYIKARVAEVTSNGEKLVVKAEDTLVKRPITIPFDMVVHAIGMDPNVDNKRIAVGVRRRAREARLHRQGERLRHARRDVARRASSSRVRRPARRRSTTPSPRARRRRSPRSRSPTARRFPRAADRRFEWPDEAFRARECPRLPSAPHLELSGPKLALAFEQLVAGAPRSTGGDRALRRTH